MNRLYRGRKFDVGKSDLIKKVIGEGYSVELRTTQPHNRPFLYIKGNEQSMFARFDTREMKLKSTEKIMPITFTEAGQFFNSLNSTRKVI